MFHKKSKWPALLGGVLFGASVAHAQTDSNKALLDLLVKKGLVTQQEAREVQNEVKAPPPAAPVAAKPAVGAPVTLQDVVVAVPARPSPLFFKIGAARFTPFGFLDLTGVYRSTNVGSGYPTSFGVIPYSNSTAGQLSETRLTAQNSRLGMKVESEMGEAEVLAYIETDFLGQTPTAVSQTSNSALFRLRNYFIDIGLHDWEFLVGQEWSLLAPDRKGISPLPSDLFYTLNMDGNYQAGLVWARQPQLRVVYHPAGEFALGLSVENPDQFVGSAVTLPTTNFNAAQVDNGSNGVTTPNAIPDVVAKVAYDSTLGRLPFHADLAGVYRRFKINTYGPTINRDNSSSGAGASFNMNLGVRPNLHLVENAFLSDGGGRYTGGLAPDFIVRPSTIPGGAYTISAVHSASGILGLEWQAAPKTMLSGYYGIMKIGRDYAQTGPDTFLGYGYPGSPNSQNRGIEEYTLGLTQTFWKDPNYGALQLITQASYLDRKPWFVAAGTPSDAHLLMFFMDVRYVLP